ncbi:hypothetical protein ABBQ38_006909 [Trebouxia sp. C0009 RCD-2024]
MKQSVKQMLQMLPEYCLVGLITFGAMVKVHELAASEIPKAYLFRGTRETTAQQVAKMLGLGLVQFKRQAGMPGPSGSPGLGRFLLPYSECDYTLESIIDDLQPDHLPSNQKQRLVRATGAAVGVGAALMENCIPGSGGRLMVFTGGPCTTGPGTVVGLALEESIRTHRDFEKGEVKQFKKSWLWYENLAQRMAGSGHCLDVFACSLDQVGIAEMHEAVAKTGGVVILAEEFSHEIYRKSLARLFELDENGHLQMYFNATLDVVASKDIRIAGATGPCTSANNKSPLASEVELGVGGTSSWNLCTLTQSTSLGMFFEVAASHGTVLEPGQILCLQFQTQYQHPSGQHRLRVTTVARPWAEPNAAEIAASFDQEAAAALIARQALFRCSQEDVFDVLRWLDRVLIRVASKFGEYTKDDPASFRWPPSFTYLPDFLFHMRRSQFLQVFNNTPDETAFYRLTLEREAVQPSMLMVQPSLTSFTFDGPPQPVLLDVASMRPDCILVLDTWFMLVVHYGKTIVEWRKAGYHLQPDQDGFRDLLAAPLEEARALLQGRIPVPKLLECDQGGSQARFLLAKLNPSATHQTDQGVASEVIFTEDVSLQVFTQHLCRLAVQS